MTRALAKLKKKADQLAEKSDLSEREKAKEVEKLYNKKMPDQKNRQQKKLVVGRAFSASGGGTGRNVKMVDARTRSDTRGDQRRKKREKAGVNKNRKGPKQHKAKSYNRKGRK